ncbi:MAG: hypothetical protein O3B13_11285 [Planctomycetota bacterium]|nr:hypothetical protein [Planctomycetota bacterium]
MKNFLEWYLGVPPAQPGQGTQWSWLYQTPWPSTMPQWSVVLVALAGLLYVGWIYGRDTQSTPRISRFGLVTLRLAVIGIVLLILSEVTLIVDRTGLPFIAVLIDDSASMGLEDQYSSSRDQAAAISFLKTSGSARRSRLAIGQGILTGNDGEFLKELQQRHQLRVYRFSETAIPVGGVDPESGNQIDRLVTLIRNLEATGDETRPAAAIRKVLNDFRGSLPTAIVIVSDGISSVGDSGRLSKVAGLAAQRLVPLYTVGIGSAEAMHDLNLYDTLVEEVAFVGDPITFTSKLKAFGFKGKNVELVLREKSSRALLTSKRLTAADDGQTLPVEITWIPEEAGDYEFILEVTPKSTEVDCTNNSEIRQVSVREGRIRVLLIDSAPRWEYRELKVLLERERTIELHTVLQDADLQYADQDATAQPLRGRFPVSRDQLFAYDTVIFGDVNLQYLSPSILENLRDFVSEAGGGLVMIAGSQFNPLTYGGTPLETLLPVDLKDVIVPPLEEPIVTPFQPQLTLEGQKSTPVFRFDEDETNSLAIWKQLPGFHWMVAAPTLKPGAVVFAEHPTRMGTDRRLPVIAMQRFGSGKVIFHATDETWSWRRRVGDLYYGRYWVQAIRYLSRSRLLGQSKSAELKSDRLVYNRGETVTLRVRFFNEEEIPPGDDPVEVVVERRGADTQTISLTKVPQAPNAFEGQFRRPVEGTYHAWVARPDFRESPPSADFRVEAPDRELRIRSLDNEELASAARTTGGKYYQVADANSLPNDVPRGRPVPIQSEEPIRLWARWEVLFLFTLLLTCEWLLRKRLRLV